MCSLLLAAAAVVASYLIVHTLIMSESSQRDFIDDFSLQGETSKITFSDVRGEVYLTRRQPNRYEIDKSGPRFWDDPHEDQQTYIAPKPELSPSDVVNINLRWPYQADTSECEGWPIRVPPAFPADFQSGNYSGYCNFSFEYDEDGKASEIEIKYCTDEALIEPTLKSVSDWRILPLCAAQPSTRQSSTVRYELVDGAGNRLPYP